MPSTLTVAAGLGHLLGLETHDVGGYIDGLYPPRSDLPGLKSLRTARWTPAPYWERHSSWSTGGMSSPSWASSSLLCQIEILCSRLQKMIGESLPKMSLNVHRYSAWSWFDYHFKKFWSWESLSKSLRNSWPVAPSWCNPSDHKVQLVSCAHRSTFVCACRTLEAGMVITVEPGVQISVYFPSFLEMQPSATMKLRRLPLGCMWWNSGLSKSWNALTSESTQKFLMNGVLKTSMTAQAIIYQSFDTICICRVLFQSFPAKSSLQQSSTGKILEQEPPAVLHGEQSPLSHAMPSVSFS